MPAIGATRDQPPDPSSPPREQERGVDSFDEIESVVLEPNGGLSVIPKR